MMDAWWGYILTLALILFWWADLMLSGLVGRL